MLKRLIICLVLIGAPLAAAAQSVQDAIVSQLRTQGFSEITMNRTWLGRVRVVALSDTLRRELVFNPQTGEILRDYWVTLEEGKDDGRSPQIFDPSDNDTDSTRDDDDDTSSQDDDDNDDSGDDDGDDSKDDGSDESDESDDNDDEDD
ncbi:hypothetical protein [Yoonia sp.]|jgi:hypothetical protein|uniref:hypothetical protein n=1 Tax=Yoonia sp. TaxID=2212373 RepID=UPI0025F304EE|nr:hypothetical protein [Yoonia sp.]